MASAAGSQATRERRQENSLDRRPVTKPKDNKPGGGAAEPGCDLPVVHEARTHARTYLSGGALIITLEGRVLSLTPGAATLLLHFGVGKASWCSWTTRCRT